MSVLAFLASGGMASIGGDLPEPERKVVNDALKAFSEKLRLRALALQVPVARIGVRRATFLFVGKDSAKYHVVFAETAGTNQLNYRDLSSHGRLDRASIAHQIRIEVGEPMWGFSIPVGIPDAQLHVYLDEIVGQYVDSILQVDRAPDQKMSPASVSHPEIASGLEKFKRDHSGKKTAFIMMQFTNSDAHAEIVRIVKATLLKHGIVGLRADDKQYMDDLFPNVKAYMHACEFGVAIFERIEADDFNPNVSLEVGYMLGMGKDVLLLKDKTLKTLPTDLTGRLYREFDTRASAASAPVEIEKWLCDKGLA